MVTSLRRCGDCGLQFRAPASSAAVAPSVASPTPLVVPSIDLRTAFDSYMSQHAYRRPATQRDIELTLNEFLNMSSLSWTTVDARRNFIKATCIKWKDRQLAKVSARSFNKKLSYLQHFLVFPRFYGHI